MTRGQRRIEGNGFHLADEIRYIQRRAAEYERRFVTVGSLGAVFDRHRGAGLLDAEGHLAARLERDGDPEEFFTNGLVYDDQLTTNVAAFVNPTSKIAADRRGATRPASRQGFPSE